MVFSKRLSSVIICYSLISIILISVGSYYSFQHLVSNEQKHKVADVVTLIDYELLELSDSPYMSFWVPHWLKANDVVELKLYKGDRQVFSYQAPKQTEKQFSNLKLYEFTLQRHDHLKLQIWMPAPGHNIRLHFDAIIIFIIALTLVFLGLWLTLKWIKKHFAGAQLLEQRANAIIGNDLYAKANYKLQAEWPKSAALAINHLQEQLSDAKKDKSRFDSFIRTNAFTDPLTGLGNKTQLRNQLSAELNGHKSNIGVILLIDLPLISAINDHKGEKEGDRILMFTKDTLNTYKNKFFSPLLTRYSGKSFALHLPLISSQDGELAAKAILKLLYRIELPSEYHHDEFYYIGLCAYDGTNSSFHIFDELEMSLRIAKLQGSSNWHIDDKTIDSKTLSKGSVRWRGLIENTISKGSIAFYSQRIFDQTNSPFAQFLSCKLLDEKQTIPASTYLSMAYKTGLTARLDSYLWQHYLNKKKQFYLHKTLTFINLQASTLLESKFQRWFKVSMLELPLSIRNNIVIQFSESQLSDTPSTLWAHLNEMKELGCKLCISDAGQSVINTAYIQSLDIDYLMLHRGLIHKIERNPINQVAIRSLIASCADMNILILAQGVRTVIEWNQLKLLGVQGACVEQLAKESMLTISSK